MIDTVKLESLLAKDPENALIRFTLGSAYRREKRYQQALLHLQRAVELDPDYSAAWKLYGLCLRESGQTEKAAEILGRGIEVATRRGDVQAAREMSVFLKRLNK